MTEETDLLSRSVALPYAFLRIALGLNICMHGIVRWATGLRSFAESLLPIFQKTPMPPWSVYSFGYWLPIVEATVGACVLFGFQTRRALISGAVLMLVLTFGSTLLADFRFGYFKYNPVASKPDVGATPMTSVGIPNANISGSTAASTSGWGGFL